MYRIIIVLLLFIGFNINAQQINMDIVNDPSVLNHYPGIDGLIGNNDDIVSSGLTTNNSSEPNSSASFSYNAFNFGGPTGENTLPTGYNAITFVNGNLTADQMVLTNGGGAIVNALEITSGTEPFVGHGAYSATISAVNSGTYNSTTKAFMINVDISFLINGFTSVEPGLILTGTAILLHDNDFVSGSGNPYIDNTIVPIAQSVNASSLLFMDGSGTLPNLGFPIRFLVIAFETDIIFKNGFD